MWYGLKQGLEKNPVGREGRSKPNSQYKPLPRSLMFPVPRILKVISSLEAFTLPCLPPWSLYSQYLNLVSSRWGHIIFIYGVKEIWLRWEKQVAKNAGLAEGEQRWGEVKSQVPWWRRNAETAGGVGRASSGLCGQEGVFLTHQYAAEMIPDTIIGQKGSLI